MPRYEFEVNLLADEPNSRSYFSLYDVLDLDAVSKYPRPVSIGKAIKFYTGDLTEDEAIKVARSVLGTVQGSCEITFRPVVV